MEYNFTFALGAATLWALSSIIINRGLRSLRRSRHPPFPGIVIGVLCSLFFGCLALFAVSGFQVAWRLFDPKIVLGGLFTFPIGTGLYYFTAISYFDRAEVSSQYANVKPAVSIFLGVALFGETLGRTEVLTSVLIAIGIAVIFAGALRKELNLRAVALGILLALSWATGEAFIRAATDSHTTLEISLGALLSSFAVSVLALIFYLTVVRISSGVDKLPSFRPCRAHLAFCVHGLLSFGVAYSLYFHSIGTIGLARTIVITVLWPSLALALNALLAIATGKRYEVERSMFVALLIFTIASVIYVTSNLA